MCCQYAEKCCQESFVTLSMHSATVNDILPLYHVLGLRSDSAILDNIGVCTRKHFNDTALVYSCNCCIYIALHTESVLLIYVNGIPSISILYLL